MEGSFPAPAVRGTFADVADINLQRPEVEKTNLGEVMEGGRWASDAVNWFYRNFTSDDGRDLYDVLIKPLAGDFNRIKANGAAWEHAGSMFWDTSENFSANATKLLDEHWSEGKAADAFNEHVNLVWTPAFYITKQVCSWMKKGFDKLAEVSIRIASKCADLLNKVLEQIIKLALKMLQYTGAGGLAIDLVAGSWEWIKNGFRWQDIPFPFWDDVNNIRTIISLVLKLHDAIRQMVTAAQSLFKGFKQVIDTIGKIPDVDSTHEGIEVVEGLKAGNDQMKESTNAYQEANKSYQKQIDGLNSMANDAVTS